MKLLTISEPQAGIPVPPRQRRWMGPLTRALWELEPGQCRDVSDYDRYQSVMQRAHVCNRLWPERHYTSRKEHGFVRVWRTR